MKYRVRLDMSFEKEADARLLVNYVKGKANRVLSINEGSSNEEISFCDFELCGHDEGLLCRRLERLEVRNR